jgi:hypothetical protein
MPTSRAARGLLLALMDMVLVVAVLLVVRIVVAFFGQLAGSPAGEAYLSATALLSPRLGVSPVPSPFGGAFDTGAAILCGGLLIIEWILSVARKTS